MKALESVLLYNFTDKEQTRKLKTVLIQMGIRIKTADHTQLNESVGYLLGIKGIESSNIANENGEVLPHELLVMKGFMNNRLNLFLSQLNKVGVPKIPYKAVITPTNQNWSLKQLYEEIEREHKVMGDKNEKNE